MLAVHLHQGWDHDNPEDISKLGTRQKTEVKDSAPFITNQQLPVAPEASSQPTLQAVAPQLDRIREVIPLHTADQGQAVYIRHFPNNPPTRGRGRRRRGGTRGGHAGNNKAKNNRFWKCDYCLCGCYPKWQPCGCACSHHKKEDCPHPDLTKVKPTETRSYRRQLTNKRCQDSGSQAHQTDKILKCDHDICEYPPEWKPRDRECSVHRKGNCSHPDPAKLGAHEKRKTEPQQNRTRDVSPSRDLINASVPPKYDTRKQIELVLHRRAEATSQETSNHQTSSLLSDVMEDEERRTRIEEENINITINDLNHCGPNTRVTGKSQNTTHTESIRDQQCPANSTTSTATGSHKQWDIDYMSMLGNSLCSTTHAKEKLPVRTSSNKARQITTQDNPSHMRRY